MPTEPRSRPLKPSEVRQARRWLERSRLEDLWRVGGVIWKAAGGEHSEHRDARGVRRNEPLLEVYVKQLGQRASRLHLERCWRFRRYWTKRDVRTAQNVGMTFRYVIDLSGFDTAANRLDKRSKEGGLSRPESEKAVREARLLRSIRRDLTAAFRTRIPPQQFRAAIRAKQLRIPPDASRQVAPHVASKGRLARLRVQRFCMALRQKQFEIVSRMKELQPMIPKTMYEDSTKAAKAVTDALKQLEVLYAAVGSRVRKK